MRVGVLLGLVLVAQAGCINNFIACTSICEVKRACVDADYDVEGCVAACEDAADRTGELEEKIQDCGQCVSDRACADVAPCLEDCPGIS
jgi:hypothetical protein